MKTLKSILAGITLLFVCVAANASAKPIAAKLTKTDVVNIYIDAIAHGNTKNLEGVLDDNLQYDMKRGDNVNTLNKDEFVRSIKNNVPSTAEVKTTTTIISDDDDASVVKIEFNFGDFVRTDVVTLNKTSGWEITKVVNSFK
jgi:Putative lumazine-binding